MPQHDIVAIGASAGGVEALQNVVARLPHSFPGSLFITLHLRSRGFSALPEILARAGSLPAVHPDKNGERIERGTIYVAPPDYHLLIEPGRVLLGHGPRENMQRPCINTMFRSAAEAYGESVVGVVLTGMLDDGAAGLWQIQQHGGVTVAQDPQDAAFPSMPESAVNGMKLDHVVPVVEIGPLLGRLAGENAPPIEAAGASGNTSQLSGYACPECFGAMVIAQIGSKGLTEFRCHTGHRYGPKTFLAEQTDAQERSLFQALGQLEEGVRLIEELMAETDPSLWGELAEEAHQRRDEAQAVRDLLGRRNVRSL